MALEMDPRLRETLGEQDHRKVVAPYIKLISVTEGAKGDRVWLWDVRMTQPNKVHIPMPAVHSLEHCIAIFIKRHVEGVINFGCMGCQTGFYLPVMNGIGGDYDKMCEALEKTLNDILVAKEVPVANEEQCGWWKNHSLEGAQEIARNVLAAGRSKWQRVFS
jgi:S-ribosylhomocysteine lyase